MKYSEILASALGHPSTQARAPKEEPREDIPEPLQALWLDHGFASYNHGFYWNTDPTEFSDIPHMWPRLKGSVVVFGRDAFANIYAQTQNGIVQLNPSQDEISDIASRLDMFFLACVTDADFRRSYMYENLFDAALSSQGELVSDECYGFFPALALGGSVDAANVRRVKLKEHLQLLSQL
jgi:hypothetical protein